MKLDKLIKQLKEYIRSKEQLSVILDINPITLNTYLKGGNAGKKQSKKVLGNVDVMLSNMSDALIEAQEEFEIEFGR